MRSAGEGGQEADRAAHALPTAIHGPRGLQPPGAAPLSGNPAGVSDLRPAARPSPSATRLSPASPAQGRLDGDRWLMASVMYGAGLRLLPACRARGAGRERLRLRVQDLDFAAGQITVRDGKGFKDRVTMLPEALKGPLRDHLARVRQSHARDLVDGYGRVSLPYALAGTYPNAAAEWGWQWVFPQEHRWVNPRTGEQGRHLPHPSPLLRNTFAPGELRHPDRSGASRAHGWEDNHDLRVRSFSRPRLRGRGMLTRSSLRDAMRKPYTQ